MPLILHGQGFEAGITIGINTSQIDGDDFGGYNKIGLHGGLEVGYRLQNNWSLKTGFFYTQLGSQRELQIGSSNPLEQGKISTDYIQIPIIIEYDLNSWVESLSLLGGVKVGYLLSSKIQDLSNDPILEFFNDWDVGLTGGIAYQINENLQGSFTFNQALTFLFNNNKVASINSNSLVHRWLTFGITFRL